MEICQLIVEAKKQKRKEGSCAYFARFLSRNATAAMAMTTITAAIASNVSFCKEICKFEVLASATNRITSHLSKAL
jgi:hypothetical protein